MSKLARTILVSIPGSQVVLAAAVVALLGACGQKGPLFLPTGPAAANRATLPQTLPPGSSAAEPAAPAASDATGTASPIRIP